MKPAGVVLILLAGGLFIEGLIGFPLEGKAASFSMEPQKKEQRKKQGAIKLEEGLFVGFLWPLYGEASSPYGTRVDPIDRGIRRHHAGVDLSASSGTRVAASRGGRVIFAGSRKNYGNLVILRHPDDMETRYGHLSAIEVKKGAFVGPGQVLGMVGSTGRSTGSHLHFEVRVSGRAVDPLKWLVPYGFMMPRGKFRK
ncbi:MAG: M23 family metallopeptidase [Synergistaceae bacterium]|jgi:murein DD-endopeptidase MepM/ murein hydrolase activator NlpD|nr:M23 family metallopeptidase [Synergistaceae bacterium]